MSWRRDYYRTGSYKTDHWGVKKVWDNDYYNLIWRWWNMGKSKQIRKKKKEILSMKGDVSSEGKYYQKLKKIVKKHEQKGKKRRRW